MPAGAAAEGLLRLTVAAGCDRWCVESPVAFTARPAHSGRAMSVLRTLRRLPRRRPVMVRMTLLFALAMVLSALMPRWITHDHDGAHTAVHALAVDAAADHLHADGAGEPDNPVCG